MCFLEFKVSLQAKSLRRVFPDRLQNKSISTIMLQLDNFYKARFVLSKVIRKTELVHTPRINPESDVYLKPECLQKTGSFKIRGAYYKISQLSKEEKEKGVIACSAGNHAQGVALGATAMGVKSLICLPEGAPISKVEATKRLGAEVCLVPGVYDDAYQKALELKDEFGYTFVHPFDDENVIAGQGTIGLEILDQLPDVEAVVVPVGGGGLISGVAFAIKSLNPNVKVYGVQAEGAASMVQSLHDHKQEKLPSVATVADGIAVKEPGKLTFETCSNYVDEIVTVSEDEICAAIQVQTDIVENLVLISDIRDTYLVRTTWTHTLNSIATIYICYSTIHSTRWLVCSSNCCPNNGFAIGRNLTTNARSGNLSHCRSHHEGEQSQK